MRGCDDEFTQAVWIDIDMQATDGAEVTFENVYVLLCQEHRSRFVRDECRDDDPTKGLGSRRSE